MPGMARWAKVLPSSSCFEKSTLERMVSTNTKINTDINVDKSNRVNSMLLKEKSVKSSPFSIWRDSLLGVAASMVVGLLTSLVLAMSVFLGGQF